MGQMFGYRPAQVLLKIGVCHEVGAPGYDSLIGKP